MPDAPSVSKKSKPPANKKASLLRRFNDWFHLWVGIVTGIPIVLISLTGCLLVFEQEITQLSRPWWNIEVKGEAHLLPPSVIRSRVQQQLPDMEIRRFWYYGLDAPVKITPEHSDSLIFANPYTGRVLALEDHENFFHLIDEGHRNLWLPPEAGRSFVTWCTVIFFVLLITGMVLWWPKKWNIRHVRQAFTINWRAKWKRVNYDLHNVLGFYSLTIGVLMAFTGVLMGFLPVRNAVYHLLGGQDKREEVRSIREWNAELPQKMDGKIDAIWHKVTRELGEKDPFQISIHYPKEEATSIYACTDMQNGTWRELYFDKETLDLLSNSQEKISLEVPSKWMMRSNFALHTGYIGGTVTKWLYFIASLICASLPITGFYIWWGKKKKRASQAF
ncbi:PepSY domain-containing protein [Pararcticibacter amylolyticus]|uniref:PepSY domain-containing protein n=2 Tax=Pararcticibacter amylolyticus TaxID=2173175 RepID=A0A2U2PIA5_9SPHI|nr:PepSY domain-containing protein [Pararcticibacter amylolyticus]